MLRDLRKYKKNVNLTVKLDRAFVYFKKTKRRKDDFREKEKIILIHRTSKMEEDHMKRS